MSRKIFAKKTVGCHQGHVTSNLTKQTCMIFYVRKYTSLEKVHITSFLLLHLTTALVYVSEHK